MLTVCTMVMSSTSALIELNALYITVLIFLLALIKIQAHRSRVVQYLYSWCLRSSVMCYEISGCKTTKNRIHLALLSLNEKPESFAWIF